MRQPPERRALTIAEVAASIGFGETATRAILKEHGIPLIRFTQGGDPRVAASDVDRLIDRLRAEQSPPEPPTRPEPSTPPRRGALKRQRVR